MYICSCRAVTDHDINDSVMSGNHTLDAVMDDTGAGDCCQSCHHDMLQVILDSLQEAEIKEQATTVKQPAMAHSV